MTLLQAHLHDALPSRIEARLIGFISNIKVCAALFIGFPSLKVRCSVRGRLNLLHPIHFAVRLLA